MKTYTDLKQSKKLAEILPIESADNVIVSIGEREGVVTTTMPKETFNTFRTPFTDIRNTIPCWSLAALMEEMNRNGWKISLECCGAEFTAKFDDGETFVMQYADNAIDAFYKMVVALHEKKML